MAGINNFNFTANFLSPSATLVWSTSSGAWDTSSPSWTSGTNSTTYSDGSVVQFNTIPGDSVVTVTGSGVSPFATTINNPSHTLTFQGGPIGGAGGFTMAGAGTVVLTASNTYGGGTNLNAGTLIVNGGDNRLGAAAGAISFAGGTLQLASANLVSSRALNVNTGGGSFDTNSFNASTSGLVTLNDAFTKAGAGNLTLTGAVIIQSPGSLNVNSGTLTLGETSGIVRQVTSSTYNGVLAVANPITVNFNNGTYSGSGSIAVLSGSGGGVLFSNNGGSNFDPSTINLPFNLNASNLPFTSSNVTQRLVTTPTANGFVATFAVSKGPNTDTMQLNGVISGNSDVNFTTSSGAFVDGVILLGASNTYTGNTNIDFGLSATLKLGVNNALPTTTNLYFAGTSSQILDLNGFNQQVASLSHNGSATPINFGIVNNGAAPATFTVSGSITPYNPFGGTITDGFLGGVVSLVKSGSNTLTLTANNGYSGGTTISGGALFVSNSSSTFSATGVGAVNLTSGTLGGVGGIGGSPGPNGAVTVQSGATLWPGLPVNVPGNQTSTPIYGTLNVLGDLALQAGSSLNYGFGIASQDLVAVAGALTLPASGAININVSDTSGLGLQNTLFTYGSLTNPFSPSEFTITGGTGFSIQLNASTDSIILVASGTNQNYVANVTWNAGSGTWDTTSPNWTGGSPNPSLYKDSPVHDRAIFADVDGMPNITVSITPSGVFPSSTTFSNSATTFTIAAGTGIGGAGQLIANGPGTVILAGTNGYSGGTVLNGGTLETGAGDLSLGATSSPLTFNGGTLLPTTTALTTARTITVNASGGTLETAGSALR